MTKESNDTTQPIASPLTHHDTYVAGLALLQREGDPRLSKKDRALIRAYYDLIENDEIKRMYPDGSRLSIGNVPLTAKEQAWIELIFAPDYEKAHFRNLKKAQAFATRHAQTRLEENTPQQRRRIKAAENIYQAQHKTSVETWLRLSRWAVLGSLLSLLGSTAVFHSIGGSILVQIVGMALVAALPFGIVTQVARKAADATSIKKHHDHNYSERLKAARDKTYIPGVLTQAQQITIHSTDIQKGTENLSLQPSIQLTETGGAIQKGFSTEERLKILNRRLPVKNPDNIKQRILQDIAAQFNIPISIPDGRVVTVKDYADEIKAYLWTRTDLNTPVLLPSGKPLSLIRFGAEIPNATTQAFLVNAIDLIVGADFYEFGRGPTSTRAIVDREHYFLGYGEPADLDSADIKPAAITLFQEFMNYSDMSNHLGQAAFHEALEALTPTGSDADEANDIHQAIINQLQRDVYGTGVEEMRRDLRQLINANSPPVEDNRRQGLHDQLQEYIHLLSPPELSSSNPGQITHLLGNFVKENPFLRTLAIENLLELLAYTDLNADVYYRVVETISEIAASDWSFANPDTVTTLQAIAVLYPRSPEDDNETPDVASDPFEYERQAMQASIAALQKLAILRRDIAPSVLSSLAHILKTSGLQDFVYQSASEAIYKIMQTNPDLIGQGFQIFESVLEDPESDLFADETIINKFYLLIDEMPKHFNVSTVNTIANCLRVNNLTTPFMQSSMTSILRKITLHRPELVTQTVPDALAFLLRQEALDSTAGASALDALATIAEINPPLLTQSHEEAAGSVLEKSYPDDFLYRRFANYITVRVKSSPPHVAENAIRLLGKTVRSKSLHDDLMYRLLETMTGIVTTRNELASTAFDELETILKTPYADVVAAYSPTKRYKAAVDTLIRLSKLNEAKAQDALALLEQIMISEGLVPAAYFAVGSTLKTISAPMNKYIQPGSVTALTQTLDDSVLHHSLAPYTIYNSPAFQNQMNLARESGVSISVQNYYSIALAVYRLLNRFGRNLSEDRILRATSFILGMRKRFGNAVLFSSDRTIINIAHREDRFRLRKMRKLETEANVTEEKIHDYKSGHQNTRVEVVKQGALDRIGETPGPLTVFFNGHGGSHHLWLEQGLPGTEDPKAMDQRLAINVEELADALMRRGSLDQVSLIISSCHAHTFSKNLLNALAARNATSFPIIVSSNGDDTYSYGDLLLDSLLKVHTPGTSVVVNDIFESEAVTVRDDANTVIQPFSYQDAVVFTPVEQGRLRQLFGEPSLSPVQHSVTPAVVDNSYIPEESIALSGPSMNIPLKPADLPEEVAEMGMNSQTLTPALRWSTVMGAALTSLNFLIQGFQGQLDWSWVTFAPFAGAAMILVIRLLLPLFGGPNFVQGNDATRAPPSTIIDLPDLRLFGFSHVVRNSGTEYVAVSVDRKILYLSPRIADALTSKKTLIRMLATGLLTPYFYLSGTAGHEAGHVLGWGEGQSYFIAQIIPFTTGFWTGTAMAGPVVGLVLGFIAVVGTSFVLVFIKTRENQQDKETVTMIQHGAAAEKEALDGTTLYSPTLPTMNGNPTFQMHVASLLNIATAA